MSDLIPQDCPKFPIGENRLNGNSLNDKLSAAIELLAMGKSLSIVARAIEVDRKTLYNWRSDPEFQEALAQRRTELWSSASDRLRSMLDSSLNVIEARLSDRYERSRFQAATTVLRLAGMQKALANQKDD